MDMRVQSDVMILNEYRQLDDVVEIYMDRKNGEVLTAIVDAKGFERIKNLPVKWYGHFDPKMGRFYVVGYLRGTGRGGKKLKLHRVITDAPETAVVDHVNGDTLDNTTRNLRVVSHQGNQRNRTRLQRNNTVGVSNVRYRKDCGKWQAYLSLSGKFKSLGYYNTVQEAGAAVEEAKKKYYAIV